jgi:16S rRNA (uracil1498-N3)-methyltransferase
LAVHDFDAQRLYVTAALAAGATVPLDHGHANYLLNVLRLRPGAEIKVFNGRDGEWRARVVAEGRKGAVLAVLSREREQNGGPDIDYVFAPLKRARLDYMVQKAVELGVARLRPVLTRHTIAERVNIERMRANAVEAAEQCGILRIPELDEPRKLDSVLAGWPEGRGLVFCDEAAEIANPIAALRAALGQPQAAAWGRPQRLAVLVGPEGGFAAEERQRLLAVPGVIRLSLGPRIMRADTAAIAVLALVGALAGDWGAVD